MNKTLLIKVGKTSKRCLIESVIPESKMPAFGAMPQASFPKSLKKFKLTFCVVGAGVKALWSLMPGESMRVSYRKKFVEGRLIGLSRCNNDRLGNYLELIMKAESWSRGFPWESDE